MQPEGKPARCYRYTVAAGMEPFETRVITEAAVSLAVNGEHWLSFTCTPTGLDVLAVGFLFNEGIIQSNDEVAAVDVCGQGTNVDVWLNKEVQRPDHWQRTSGCTGGVTSTAAGGGTNSNAAGGDINSNAASNGDGARGLEKRLPAGETGSIAPRAVLACMEQLLQVQELYREARGVHCSALSDGSAIHAVAEDIGRHNTLDKLAGQILREPVRCSPSIIITTGRISSEMLQKSARIGASAVISRTSPTSMSVALAETLGITLIGYARRNGFTVYAHPERLTADLGPSPVLEPALLPGEIPQCY